MATSRNSWINLPEEAKWKTYCIKGHLLDKDNTHIQAGRYPVCRKCIRERARNRYRLRRFENASHRR